MQPPGAASLKFAPSTGFYEELKARVAEHFTRLGRAPRGGAALHVKTATIIAWLLGSYLFVVFFAASWWQLAAGVLSLALAIAAVG
ncbi:MAG: acyl-CoA desaturase, partial [Acidobacteriota bacterium]